MAENGRAGFADRANMPRHIVVKIHTCCCEDFADRYDVDLSVGRKLLQLHHIIALACYQPSVHVSRVSAEHRVLRLKEECCGLRDMRHTHLKFLDSSYEVIVPKNLPQGVRRQRMCDKTHRSTKKYLSDVWGSTV